MLNDKGIIWLPNDTEIRIKDKDGNEIYPRRFSYKNRAFYEELDKDVECTIGINLTEVKHKLLKIDDYYKKLGSQRQLIQSLSYAGELDRLLIENCIIDKFIMDEAKKIQIQYLERERNFRDKLNKEKATLIELLKIKYSSEGIEALTYQADIIDFSGKVEALRNFYSFGWIPREELSEVKQKFREYDSRIGTLLKKAEQTKSLSKSLGYLWEIEVEINKF